MTQKHILACLIGAFILLLWPGDASAACLSRPYEEVPQTPAEKRGQMVHVLVAEEDVTTLENRGFQLAECSKELADERTRLDYRNELCQFVASVNELVESQAERALGAPPALLCSSAEKLLGRWSGEPGPTSAKPRTVSRRIVDGEGAAIAVTLPERSGDVE